MSLVLQRLAVLLVCLCPAMGEARADATWYDYNRTYDGQRFSPLTEIRPGNVATLKPVCEVEVGELGAFSSGLIVVGGRMYLTTGHTTVALDAASCRPLWRHVYQPVGRELLPANRGPALDGRRVFRGTPDGHLLALDARSGRELWRVKACDSELGEFLSAAPLVWRDRVFIGTAGGDWGIRGRMMAFDAKTGRLLWQFNLIPAPGEPGFETWHIPESAQRGGGGTWASFSLDEQTGELFVPVGNPAPDFAPEARPGDNLYTNSVVVLDGLTGKLKWYHQLNANDPFDHDLGAAPIIYKTATGRAMVAAGSKDGHVYGIDRATHQRLFKVPVTTIEDHGPPTPEGVRHCPGTNGGVGYNGPAYDAPRNQLVVGAIDGCMIYKRGPVDTHRAGDIFMGTRTQADNGPNEQIGWISAVDAETGALRWRFRSSTTVLAGITPTAGGVIFAGNTGGDFLTLDATTGAELFRLPTGGSLAGGIVTYEAKGRQRVAFTSGSLARGQSVAVSGKPKVVVLALADAAPARPAMHRIKLAQIQTRLAIASAHDGTASGLQIYQQHCAICHGSGGEGIAGPRLKGMTQTLDGRLAEEVIKDPKPGMPRLYPAYINDHDLALLLSFLKAWR